MGLMRFCPNMKHLLQLLQKVADGTKEETASATFSVSLKAWWCLCPAVLSPFLQYYRKLGGVYPLHLADFVYPPVERGNVGRGKCERNVYVAGQLPYASHALFLLQLPHYFFSGRVGESCDEYQRGNSAALLYVNGEAAYHPALHECGHAPSCRRLGQADALSELLVGDVGVFPQD